MQNLKSFIETQEADIKANLSPETLIEEANKALFQEFRHEAGDKLKQLITRQYALFAEKESLLKKIKSIDEKIAKNQAKIDAVKSGDWSVLFKLLDEDQQQNKEEVKNN